MAQSEVQTALDAKYTTPNNDSKLEDDSWPQDDYDGDLLALAVIDDFPTEISCLHI